jgi:chorismate binding enzyme
VLSRNLWQFESEATLVLRTVFQDKKRTWIQAGAGIIAQSTPERELIETKEKLASVVPFLVGKGESTEMPEGEANEPRKNRPSFQNREWSEFVELSK